MVTSVLLWKSSVIVPRSVKWFWSMWAKLSFQWSLVVFVWIWSPRKQQEINDINFEKRWLFCPLKSSEVQWFHAVPFGHMSPEKFKRVVYNSHSLRTWQPIFLHENFSGRCSDSSYKIGWPVKWIPKRKYELYLTTLFFIGCIPVGRIWVLSGWH